MKKVFALLTVFIYSANLAAAGSADGTNTSASVVSTAGANQSANQSKKNNNNTAVIAQVVSMGLMVASIKPTGTCATVGGGWACPIAAMLIGMAGMAGKQSGANGGAAGNSAWTAGQTDGIGFGGNGDGTTDPNSLANKISSEMFGGNTAAAKSALSKLTSPEGLNGVKFDPKTGKITTPDGKTYSASDFSSAAAMKAAGFSDADINGALGKVAKLEKDALDKLKKIESAIGKAGFDEGGGGGAFAKNGSESSGANDANVSGLSGSAGSLPRDPAGSSVAGLSKMYNGEPIGISQDSIFSMMNRRYKIKEKQDSFFTEAELLQK